jgi:hypothetical protein
VTRSLARAEALSPDGVRPEAFQGASLGLAIPPIASDCPVFLEGMHPEHSRLGFRTPPAPQLAFDLGGDVESLPARMTLMRIEPDAMRVSFVYAAIRSGLPKRFVAGLHPAIPLRVTIDGVVAVDYEPPPVWRRDADPFAR